MVFPPWFDPEEPFTNADDDPDLVEIMDILGFDDWNDILINRNDLTSDELRPGRYQTPGDALRNMLDSAIVFFGFIYYDSITDTWAIGVSYGPTDP